MKKTMMVLVAAVFMAVCSFGWDRQVEMRGDTTPGNIPVVERGAVIKDSGVSVADLQSTDTNLQSQIDATAATYIPFNETYATTNATATTLALPCSSVRNWIVTLGTNTAITVTGLTAGKDCTVKITTIQDATGGRTVTWPSAKWQFGYVPTVTATTNAVDVYYLTSIDGGTNCYGFIAAQDIK